MTVRPSLYPYQIFPELPITGSGKFKNTNSGNIVNLVVSVEHTNDIPKFYVIDEETKQSVSVSSLDDIPNAELTLCMLINKPT